MNLLDTISGYVDKVGVVTDKVGGVVDQATASYADVMEQLNRDSTTPSRDILLKTDPNPPVGPPVTPDVTWDQIKNNKPLMIGLVIVVVVLVGKALKII